MISPCRYGKDGKTLSVTNKDTGCQIMLSGKSVRDALYHAHVDAYLKTIPHLPELISNAIYACSMKKAEKLISHLYITKIKLDGEDKIFSFLAREDINGIRFYDHEITNIIGPDSHLTPGHQSGIDAVRGTNQGHIMQVLRDVFDVNGPQGNAAILIMAKMLLKLLLYLNFSCYSGGGLPVETITNNDSHVGNTM